MIDTAPALPVDAMPASASAQVVRHPPEFNGKTGEYFGIWFVNLLLSLVTLGIYSAWAKVRTERYFYGNTRLAGSSFDYLADPVAILKGRLIAYAVVIVLVLSSHFLPVLYVLMILALFALMPLIVVLALRFRARNSAWRGLSFRFDRSGGAAYGPFFGWPLLNVVSGTLLYPLMKLRQHEFVAGGHGFGRKRFEFAGDASRYYTPYLIALGIGLRVRYANLLWNNTRLGPHRFESSLRVRDMLWLYASNLVAIVCTLGLAVPWAMIRLARYRAAHFAVLAQGPIDDFVRDLEREHAAAGAEMIDALDVGVDLGL